jgi:hypothetical protein
MKELTQKQAELAAAAYMLGYAKACEHCPGYNTPCTDRFALDAINDAIDDAQLEIAMKSIRKALRNGE